MSSELSYDAALELVLAACPPLPVEVVDLRSARGRILAADVIAPESLPRAANSAMDGFAVSSSQIIGSVRLPTTPLIAAGTPPLQLPAGWAAPIATGALVPDGADAIVPIEDATATDHDVVLSGPIPVGAHVRVAGSDVAAGMLVATSGSRLGTGEAAMFAALGIANVQVHRRPRVAILATGSELVPLESTPGVAQIRESNSIALAWAIERAGAEANVLPIARDDPDALRALLAEGLTYDLLVTSGGVSVGHLDLVRATLSDLGAVERFWRVALKPGKPCVLATTTTCTVLGLPGNPASALVGMALFVRPAILAMSGASRTRPVVEMATAVGAWPGAVGRLHAVRCRTERDESGTRATPTGDQGSHRIGSLIASDALALIAPGQQIHEGDQVVVTGTDWVA